MVVLATRRARPEPFPAMDRRNFQIRLTDDARAGWDRLCAAERVTMTALVEAIGLELGDGRNVVTRRAIDRAADIDRERKSRR